MTAAALAFRFALGTMFSLSALAKVPDLEGFHALVRDYRLVPRRVSRTVALSIPSIEALLGICLLLGIAVQVAAAMAALLLVAFTVALAVNLARGRRVGCGCFGTITHHEISLFAVLRNVCLIGLSTTVAWSAPIALSPVRELNTSAQHAVSASGGVAMLITGALAALALSLGQEVASVTRLYRAFKEGGLS
jgi:uncharacterized membrane protein YphA (DoxX/SURF4 family)